MVDTFILRCWALSNIRRANEALRSTDHLPKLGRSGQDCSVSGYMSPGMRLYSSRTLAEEYTKYTVRRKNAEHQQVFAGAYECFRYYLRTGSSSAYAMLSPYLGSDCSRIEDGGVGWFGRRKRGGGLRV